MQYVTISAFTLLNKRTTRLSVVANETVANETAGARARLAMRKLARCLLSGELRAGRQEDNEFFKAPSFY